MLTKLRQRWPVQLAIANLDVEVLRKFAFQRLHHCSRPEDTVPLPVVITSSSWKYCAQPENRAASQRDAPPAPDAARFPIRPRVYVAVVPFVLARPSSCSTTHRRGFALFTRKAFAPLQQSALINRDVAVRQLQHRR